MKKFFLLISSLFCASVFAQDTTIPAAQSSITIPQNIMFENCTKLTTLDLSKANAIPFNMKFS